MRIATSTYQSQWLTSMQRQQEEIATTQQQVSTGKRIITAADDPAGAAQSILLQQGLNRLDNYAANAETAQRRLSLEEGSLSQATDTLNRIRELSIQAATGTQTQESRSAIVAEANQLLTGLLNTANAQDGEGRYLFAGNLVQQRPFVLSGSVQYVGDSGTRSQAVADARTVQEGDPGSAVFMQIPSGNGSFTVASNAANTGTASWSSATVTGGTPFVSGTYTLQFNGVTNSWDVSDASGPLASIPYTAGGSVSFQGATIEFQGTPAAGDQFTVAPARFQDVFKTVQDFITTLGMDTGSPARRATFQNQLNSNLQNLDQALQQISNTRSQVGARLATIDQETSSNADVQVELKRSLSVIRDVDYATAVSQLQLQLTSLEAAQKTYARTQSLSLFNVL